MIGSEDSMDSILQKINSPSDLKDLDLKELEFLAGEIRKLMVDTVSKNGGHLASNLGIVELTIAIHKVFKSPLDQIVFDVGHQAYVHKILTGRKNDFFTLRTENGISGFTRPDESEHDVFFSGHSSTAVSSAYGLAIANNLNSSKNHVVAVVGDGSFTGGLVFEGLNNAGRNKSKLIVVLNDNEMSISKNVGSFAKYLAVVRSKPEYERMKSRTEKGLSKIPFIGKHLTEFIYNVKTSLKNFIYKSTMFEDMGFRYMGPIDGHNIEQLCNALESAKMIKSPVLLHVKTIKGKGYDFAEQQPSEFHGISKFDINTGEPLSSGESFSSVFGDYLCCVASKDKRICAITAAMTLGTGLEKFSKEYPDRFFDVGIAEQHAVTFASGLSKNGKLPVFAVYSTFLQRSYDQIIHDGALQKSRFILAIDRAGFVGEDGETHQGLFDVAFLNTIPDIEVYSPSSFDELKSNFNTCLYHSDKVCAIRYPRGAQNDLPEDFTSSFDTFDVYGNIESKNVIVTYGRIFFFAAKATKKLNEKYDNDFCVLKLNRIKPIDNRTIEIFKNKECIFVFEESVKSGGVGEKIAQMLLENSIYTKFHITAVCDEFVKCASVCRQLEKYHLDENGIITEVEKYLG